ncbi:MAG TPA: hypothetical protein VFX70_14015 [Mycobacteriales bacterium]|nr:hypothetical protein [Mycobacteriales bacterium]
MRPSAIPELDNAYAYRILDWLVRTWLPGWIPSSFENHEVAVEVFCSQRPIKDMQTATSAARLISLVDMWERSALEQEAGMKAAFLGDIAVDAARRSSTAALKDSAGRVTLDVVSSALPEACDACRLGVGIKAAESLAFIVAADKAIDAIVAMATAPDVDVRRIVARNMAPVAASVALEPIVESLQDAALELHEELLSM